MFSVEAKFLLHSGGTKFYEAVLISESVGRAMLIKRYGPIAKMKGGGGTIIERGNRAAMMSNRRLIENEKKKLRGGGSYGESDKLADYGLYVPTGAQSDESLIDAVGAHYSDKVTIQAVFEYFNIPRVSPVTNTKPVRPAEPEPIRDAGWGSW